MGHGSQLISTHIEKIADELNVQAWQVAATCSLLQEGATVPFIARYRKERTGLLDEVAVTAVRDRLAQLEELDKRREAIFKSLDERELLTEELKAAIESAETLAALEDIYLPYRPKRRTRATVARERGLEPLAQTLFRQIRETNPTLEASGYVDPEKGVSSLDDALAGARDIIAEWINEDAGARERMRRLFMARATIQSRIAKGKENEGAKYRDYFDSEGAIGKVPGHRVLAMFRGENEGFLRLAIRPPDDGALALLERHFVRNDSASAHQVRQATADSYQRLLAPSMETETRGALKERADAEAIEVFARNLREALMAAPLGQRAVLAIDPGYRTGCKVVCLDRQGKLLHHTTIFIGQSARKDQEAGKTMLDLIERFGIEAIAIGNGTASRETDVFVRGLGLAETLPIIMVNESGASIYSTSEAAREEFPDHDATIRGAVSIGRRLMDPLAELVKIDPKSIGVGQYQHDVDQARLKAALDDTMISCVNAVGVEVNTASKQLLTYVSGLGPALAANIVRYREDNGPFRSRRELSRVSRLGPKAFEQAAGFLRIRDGENVLDRSAVHPESYPIVERMAADMACSIRELMSSPERRERMELERYITDSIGIPTLQDILEELAKPGRDPRQQFEPFAFAPGVRTIEHLAPGMRVPGIVTNVTNFGAFVDIGVHQDGLVHISQMADHFVRNPNDVVKLGQKVTVTVLDVDRDRNRIALSLLPVAATPP